MIPERLIPGTDEWEQYHYEHEQRYEFFAARYVGLDVLDAACGIGYGSAIIARRGAKSVTGIDIAPEAIEYARKNYARPGVSFESASAEALGSLGKTFDLVVSFETIEHLKAPRVFLRQVRQVLRPGGTFICSSPNRDFAGKPKDYANPYHLSEMSLEEFTAAFCQEFELEGRYHQSHSELYRRHLDLVGVLDGFTKAVRFSKVLALENRVRGWLGKAQWHLPPPSPRLTRVVPGDYVIEAFDASLTRHLTYILVGHGKA